MESLAVFCSLLFIVSFLYGSVGHGGASGYLALMAIFNVAPDVMKPTALLLNIFVSVVSFVQFYRAGHFNLRLFLPFAFASVPFSFLGGLVQVDGAIYKQVLGLLLFIPVARFLYFGRVDDHGNQIPDPVLSLVIGGGIGFLSGLIGIGGGILLSPVVLLLGWAGQKQTAAISALFILVNSLSGLSGQFIQGIRFSTDMVAYVAVVLAGGAAGAYFGALRFQQNRLKHILAFVLFLAACKLVFAGI
ncbi:MAG TPA: sulfite exporter TauE/SafE family protein [Sphingobacteriaceae bacterium]